jgi:acetyltransferase-like isoleucine patch superfamily enzyme
MPRPSRVITELVAACMRETSEIIEFAKKLRPAATSMGVGGVLSIGWARFWMLFAGLPLLARPAMRIATWFAPPYYGRYRLARFNRSGYVSPAARLAHSDLTLGANVYIGDRVVVYRDRDGGPVTLADRVHVENDSYIQTGEGGSVAIGPDTYIQVRCQFSAYKASIVIGAGVQIGPNCAFYPYDHGVAPGVLIARQPLRTRGDIVIEDDAWVSFGVIVLSGVRIGTGAVVGAGAVVTSDIPAGAIAAGVPARVLRMRGDPPAEA